MTNQSQDKSLARVLRQMSDAVGLEPERAAAEDAFVGFFQSFRPDGNGLKNVFDGLAVADELHERLEELFEVAGDDRRPQGGRDAYFVVRKPQRIAPALAEMTGRRWIDRMAQLAKYFDRLEAAETLSGIKTIRVLEGIPPKHPRQEIDKTDLLKLVKDEIPTWLADSSIDHEISQCLRSPYYFVNCDPMLRDYLMWPLYREQMQRRSDSSESTELSDPMEPYFQLWKHGIKWRVYQEQQIDLYLPRS